MHVIQEFSNCPNLYFQLPSSHLGHLFANARKESPYQKIYQSKMTAKSFFEQMSQTEAIETFMSKGAESAFFIFESMIPNDIKCKVSFMIQEMKISQHFHF